MLLPRSVDAAALASLLVGLAATAQAAPAGGAAPRSVVLTGKAGEAPLLYLSPDVPTFILLDAPIVRESVQVEGRARFARVDPGDQGITLALAVPLGPTERLALRFTYREGSPQSVVFLLTGQPGTVDTVVNVSRPQQTVEACRVELSATRERCEAQSQGTGGVEGSAPSGEPGSRGARGARGRGGHEGWRTSWKRARHVAGELARRPVQGARGVNVDRGGARSEQHRGGAVGARVGRSHARSGRGATPRPRGALGAGQPSPRAAR